MEVIIYPNNGLFQSAVHQIQSYNCLFEIKMITSTHNSSKLHFGSQKDLGYITKLM